MKIKETVRKILITLHLDLTKNLLYDRLTTVILKKSLKPNSNCIDVGCHKGEILDIMLEYATKGQHFAFEPIPYLNENLVEKYGKRVSIYPYALSDSSGKTTFNLVKNAPAYSGLKQREYAVKTPDIEQIQVELKRLDDVIPTDIHIDFLKIDVEGGEFGVLKGAKELLLRSKPTILFESGKGASEFYGTTPQDLFDYLHDVIGMKIYTLKAFVKSKNPLSKEEYIECFETNSEYGFVAVA